MSRKHKLDPRSPFAALQPLKQQMQSEAEAEAEARRAPPPPPPPARKTPTTPEVWRPNLEAELFRAAMSGVQPLAAAPARVTTVATGPTRRPSESLGTRLRKASAEGGPAHEVKWAADGTVRGWRRGHEFALEVLDRFAAPADTLDVHGCEAHEAAARVVEFVRSRRARRMRCVCVVHGWGKRSPDGASVLSDAVVKALGAPPAAAEVDAFASAPDNLGGRGAILVSLRA
jgi:DNA-nicking Smr family endonuclease